MMYSDWVWPLSLVLAVRVLMETMAPYPMLRLMFLLLLDTHMVRRLVTTSSPLSPVFPFVSSTPWRWSISNSPLRRFRSLSLTSKRISRSCHTAFGPSFLLTLLMARARCRVNGTSRRAGWLAEANSD